MRSIWDIPENMLTAWREECRGIATRCWMKVMNCWLNKRFTPYPPTWDGLYEMLEDTEYAEEARRLREAVEQLQASSAS